MKVLFDQGTSVPLRRHLHPHFVDTSAERGWSTLQNGELLNQAEFGDYEVFVTTDRNLKYQQNLTGRKIRILVLTTTSWPRISDKVAQIRQALENLNEGGYIEVEI
jgi:predicted nuclease of predicted toxin-antitoxin system